MARKAQVIDHIADAWGDRWSVREYRKTEHGLTVGFGWPDDGARGRGGSGGVRVIVTSQLASYFEEYRASPGHMSLPIGRTAITRIRRLLGHHRQIDRAAWWEERSDQLLDLTVTEFAFRHKVAIGAVSQARAALYGNKLRPAGWWRQPDIAAVILDDKPTSSIADDLNISVGAVRRLRHCLKKGRKQ